MSNEAKRKYHREYAAKRLSDPKVREATNARRRKWAAKRKAETKQSAEKWAKNNPLNYMISVAKRRAKAANLEFSIVPLDLEQVTHCPVFGLELLYGRGNGKRQASTASLDRIDNSKGYIPGNVEIVSWRANNLKSDASLEELEALVAYMKR